MSVAILCVVTVGLERLEEEVLTGEILGVASGIDRLLEPCAEVLAVVQPFERFPLIARVPAGDDAFLVLLVDGGGEEIIGGLSGPGDAAGLLEFEDK